MAVSCAQIAHLLQAFQIEQSFQRRQNGPLAQVCLLHQSCLASDRSDLIVS